MQTFKALQVSEVTDNKFSSTVINRHVNDLPEGEVLIQVHYSSLNYKDALSASGNRGVTRNFPHTPGIDAAGVVISSESEKFKSGQEVIVTGYDLGMNTAGGYGQLIRIPASWIVKKPEGITLKDCMILGTAGLTAALCVEKLLQAGVTPSVNNILVTGASGGVGSVAISLLHKLGFSVTASSGKPEKKSLLKSLGANDVIDRDELLQNPSKPLLKGRWGGAIDTVGGLTLSGVLKSIIYDGSVACCGLVESPDLQTSLLPFLLRNVNLLGVDSVELSLQHKQATWAKLANEWKLDYQHLLSEEIRLEQIPDYLQRLLAGQSTGRVVVNLQD